VSANLLTDARLADIACRDRGSLWMPIAARLAREVQASRKLIADLRALHVANPDPDQADAMFCDACDHPAPCPTLRLIEAAGL